MRVLRFGVRLRVARAHGNAPEANPAGQFANTPFVQVDSERSRDPFTQINQAPADDPIDLRVGTGPHPCLEFGFLLSGQFPRRTATASADRTAR
jgi:hypothetical protein